MRFVSTKRLIIESIIIGSIWFALGAVSVADMLVK